MKLIIFITFYFNKIWNVLPDMESPITKSFTYIRKHTDIHGSNYYLFIYSLLSLFLYNL